MVQECAMRSNLSKIPTKITTTGIIHTGPCEFRGFLMGTDGVNDPTITIYNGINNTGQEVVPTATYDAAIMGLNGVTGKTHYCNTGLYIEITCAGAVEVVPEFKPVG
jgi:hypothetical protein